MIPFADFSRALCVPSHPQMVSPPHPHPPDMQCSLRVERRSRRKDNPGSQGAVKPPPSPAHGAAKVLTVTGMGPLGVTILITVVVLGASKPPSSKLSSLLAPHALLALQKY